MIQRYTLLGGVIALVMIALQAFWQGAAPGLPGWIAAMTALLIACLIGWAAARRDSRDLRRLQRQVAALSDRDFGKRTRMQRPDAIGELGRSLDALSERLSTSEIKKQGRKDRLQTIVDAMAEAVLVTDAEGRIKLSNEVLADLVGFDPTGKTAIEAIRHPDFHRAIEDAQQGFSGLHEIEINGLNARSRHILRASVSPLRNQQGVVAVFHDVTAERAAAQVRRDFVANAGHELRTPLTAIRGFAETLRDGALDDPKAAMGFIEVILRHTRRLQALVDDLADLSSFEGKELELDLVPVNAGAALSEVVRGLEAQSKAKGLKVNLTGLDDAPLVLAEERALEQVLVNLVDNAIKYTPERGEIRIDIAPEGRDVFIEVANSGPGIPARHLSRVFERFYRVDAGRSRELGGTGLGLSIVKHLVAKMRGEINVDSSAGWTRFQLCLPLADSPNSDTSVSRN
ncbi:MAG TPA: ATP-binding protein [Polyangiales bacterium]|nr:ATP-binding protein [Polyangiales bacterium]